MARIRTIKPEFQNSQSMGRVSRDARLVFIELWPQCDDAGRIRANSRMLASILFPYDLDAPDLIDGWLAELEKENCITRYRIGNDDYLQVLHWSHQKIDHPKTSEIPPPPAKKSRKTKLSPREDSRSVANIRAVSSTVSDFTVPDRTVSASRFDEFYLAYPRKEARGAAEKAWPVALKLTDADTLIAGARAYSSKRVKEDKKFTKLPATWLNQKCWEDDGIAPVGDPMTPDEIAASQDKADRYFKRGKYAETYA